MCNVCIYVCMHMWLDSEGGKHILDSKPIVAKGHSDYVKYQGDV